MYSMRLCLKSFLFIFLLSCQHPENAELTSPTKNQVDTLHVVEEEPALMLGAERMDTLVELLRNEVVGVVANQTSRVEGSHLVDTLIKRGIEIKKVFSPEHGFRGEADAGASVESAVDKETGLPIVSLYGSNKKPKADQLEGLTTVIFDIQDVGARFYTYISTLHYVMEACAENGVKVVVLDRPNPNGHYVDGPIRKEDFESFVGMHPIPIVHGMTVGEIANMINGEGWLKGNLECDLSIISLLNYSRDMKYSLPVAPSPNLRTDKSIILYPSLCLFEGTVVSVGRGTDKPFEIFGHPDFSKDSTFQYSFIPEPGFGSKHPKLEGQECYGLDLGSQFEDQRMNEMDLRWLISAYQNYEGNDFFTKRERWFDLLAGTDELRIQIKEGKSADEIKLSWQDDLNAFKQMRTQYLIYP